MEFATKEIDVLCIGMACWDISFAIEHHPDENEKMVASGTWCGGGGPAANAAICVSRLGGQSSLACALGHDVNGNAHLAELRRENVDTCQAERVEQSTPVAVSLTKPDGKRSVINSGSVFQLREFGQPLERLRPKVVLVDGHQPFLAIQAIEYYRKFGVQVVLDAGSLHDGTKQLLGVVDHVVASQKFAASFSASEDPVIGISSLSQVSRSAVITLGESGVLWRGSNGDGWMNSFSTHVVDENGAGDAFHGAFAFGLSRQMEWLEILKLSSAAGAVACEKFGAGASMPYWSEIERMISSQQLKIETLEEIEKLK